MQLEQDLKELAERIMAGAIYGPPFTLVIGARCARAAAVPSLEELSERAGQSLRPTDRRLIERVLYDIPVPAFYQHAANLAREGYLPWIVSTGYDTLIERALIDAGLRPGHHFSVIDIGASAEESRSNRGPPPPSPWGVVHVFDSAEMSASPGLIDAAVRGQGASHPLRAIVAGYEFESPALTDWLVGVPQGELWWVAPDPAGDARDRLRWSGDWMAIEGDAASPAEFFSQLSVLIFRLPGYEADSAAVGDELDDDVYARSQLEQAKTVKHSIEQRVLSSGSDPAATSQLNYQTKQIGELEQRLARSSAPVLDQMRAFRVELAQAVANPNAGIDPAALDVFTMQLETLERELSKPEPSRAIVAAAEGSLTGLINEFRPRLRGTEAS